jgi:hypothetical protein
MLWDAGQERLTRENRGRLVELYTGVRDGYVAANVSLGKAKAKGDITPTYARIVRPAPTGTPAERDATLVRLGIMFPGIVRRADS